jgi:SecD/SecF fusion protein
VGFAATIALASYALLAYAMLVGLGSTLTLPGLAGFVLAIGMAIDANVLVFERAREEYAAYPSAGLRRALAVGFNKAWSAIIDSNVTTLLAAGLLFFLGSGPIKGFGVTLTIGVVASMVSALIIARVLCDLAVANKPVASRPRLSGLGDVGKVRTWLDRKNPDLMKRRQTWLGISAVALVIAIAGIVTQGLQLGVEFTGGRQLDYSVSKDVTVDQARAAVADAGFPEAVVQTADTGDTAFTVRTSTISNDEEQRIEDELAKVGGNVTKIDDQTIGASLGKELRNNALIAFGVAFLAQLLYLAVRFKWTFGVSAVVAMAHDVVLVVGLFAWLQKPIDGIFLAAAMTIIGLSVNDTVVVFDRVRERWYGSKPDEKFNDLANKAAVETVPRTVNTGLGAMFILAALAVLGGDSLQDFAIALLVGLVVGTYSSVFMATPLLTYFQERWPMGRVKKERVVRDPEDSGAVV